MKVKKIRVPPSQRKKLMNEITREAIREHAKNLRITQHAYPVTQGEVMFIACEAMLAEKETEIEALHQSNA